MFEKLRVIKTKQMDFLKKNFEFKLLFLDVVKYYVYLLLLKIVLLVPIWMYFDADLETYKLELDTQLFSVEAEDMKSPDLDLYFSIIDFVSNIAWAFACFFVFFSKKLRSFFHVTLVSIILFGFSLLSREHEQGLWGYNFLFLYCFILLSWYCSKIFLKSSER